MTDLAAATPARSRAPRWRRRLARNPLAVLGIILIGFFLLIVAFAPFLAPYSPTTQNLRTTYLPPGTGVSFSGPDGQRGIWVSPSSRTPIGGVTVDDEIGRAHV